MAARRAGRRHLDILSARAQAASKQRARRVGRGGTHSLIARSRRRRCVSRAALSKDAKFPPPSKNAKNAIVVSSVEVAAAHRNGRRLGAERAAA